MATIQQCGSSFIQALFNAAPTQTQINRAKAAFSAGLPPDATNEQVIAVMLREGKEWFLARLEQREVEAAVVALRSGKTAELAAAFPEIIE